MASAPRRRLKAFDSAWSDFVADPIAFIDLQAQRRRLGEPLNKAIQAAVEGGQWILGPQVAQFEKDIAAWAGVKHAIACANGTDALLLVLRAWGVGPGDAVFVPAFTFAATGEVVALAGASPVFVDVLPDTFNMDPASLEAAIALVKREGKLKAQGGDAGGSVRPARRLSRAGAHRGARRAEAFLRHGPGFWRACWTASGPAPSAMPRPPASFPPSRWAVMAMAAPVSPMMTG